MEPLDPQLWLLVILGAFVLGLSKGGIMGLNNITIAVFALIFPPKLSVGIILLLLIVGDWGVFYFTGDMQYGSICSLPYLGLFRA